MAHDSDPLPPPSVDPDAGLIEFTEQLRAQDPAFAEASILYPEGMGEWQGAVYLLTGCAPVWQVLGETVIAERWIAPVINEIDNPRRAWSSSETEVMAWAAHFWEVERHPAHFPWRFRNDFLFERWIAALYLRRGEAPPTARLIQAAAG